MRTVLILLVVACSSAKAPAPQTPQAPAQAPTAADAPAEAVPAAPVDDTAEPAPPALPAAPVPSTYTIDGKSLSVVTLTEIEKALTKAGCKKFKDRTTQTTGPYELLETHCTTKQNSRATVTLRRPAVPPKETSLDPEPYSPATWAKKFPGELYNQPANTYVDILVNADSGDEARTLFDAVVKAPA